MAIIHKEHENWSSRLTFLLAAIGAAVGLGNIWKFPYITGQNGGGAFVLVYLLAVFFVAIPDPDRRGRRGALGPPEPAERDGERRLQPGAVEALVTGRLVRHVGRLPDRALTTASSPAGPSFTSSRTPAGDFSGQDAAAISAQFNALLASPGAVGPVARYFHGAVHRHPDTGIAERDRGHRQGADAGTVRSAVGHGGLRCCRRRHARRPAFHVRLRSVGHQWAGRAGGRGPGLFLDRRGHGPDDGIWRLSAPAHLHCPVGDHHCEFRHAGGDHRRPRHLSGRVRQWPRPGRGAGPGVRQPADCVRVGDRRAWSSARCFSSCSSSPRSPR